MKLVVSPAPIEKPCQLMMALGVLVTVRTLPTWLIAAVPLTICAPMGLAWALKLKQQASAMARGLMRSFRVRPYRLFAFIASAIIAAFSAAFSTLEPERLLFALASSDTATQVFSVSDQME